MFKAAAGALNLSERDFWRIVMVGNNLSRDIKGANDAGITSIFLKWSPRYPHTPADPSEVPDYTVSQPLDLLGLIENLNNQLVNNNLNLMQQYAPALYFDNNEPFYPIYIGCTLFTEPGASPSFNRTITFRTDEVQYVIEYAIYWDFDIQHLYELEHVWVSIDRFGDLVDCEASFHGFYLKGLRKDRCNIEGGTHVRLYSQPGKHAFSPYSELFELLPDLVSSTDEDAGSGGLLVTAVGAGLYETDEETNNLVKEYLSQYRFRPTMNFTKYDYSNTILIPWSELKRRIPDLIQNKLKEIRACMSI